MPGALIRYSLIILLFVNFGQNGVKGVHGFQKKASGWGGQSHKSVLQYQKES